MEEGTSARRSFVEKVSGGRRVSNCPGEWQDATVLHNRDERTMSPRIVAISEEFESL